TSLGTVEALDTTTNTWSPRALMPTPRRFFAAGAVNGHVFAAGGDDARSLFQLIEEYDPVADQWRPLPVWIPEILLRPTGAAVGGALYVEGPVANSTRVALYQYDVFNQVWTEKRDLPTTRRGSAMAAVGPTLYAAGGRTQEGVELAAMEAY